MEYTIKPASGYSEKIGELVFMLGHVRMQTLKDIEGLQQSQLDKRDAGNGNSIGALLAHIAAIEKVHQLISFEGRDFTEAEFAEWGPALMLGERSQPLLAGNTLDYYIEGLSAVREATLQKLQEKDDAWLYEERSWPNGTAYNMYYLWFHVLEDEISHRGQIRAAMRRLSEGGGLS